MKTQAGVRRSIPLADAIRDRSEDLLTAVVRGERSALTERLTPVTRELLDWWFHEDSEAVRASAGRPNFHAGQRDAILATIYAHEVLESTSMGQLYDELLPGWLRDDVLRSTVDVAEISDPENAHPKYAIKMATGTGKTWVLNALLIWQYLNAVARPDDRRFTKNFLIVAPGLIVYDRLLDSFKGKPVEAGDGGEASPQLIRDYRTSDIHANQELFIPDRYRESVHAFVQGGTVEKSEIGRRTTPNGIIAITNWHLLAGKDKDVPEFLPEEQSEVFADGADPDPKSAASSFIPLSPGTTAGNSLDVLDRRATRGAEFEWLRELPDLLVFNDEAHHIHKVKRGGRIDPVEWQRALTEIGEKKGDRFTQIDFSATPYGEQGGRGGKKKIYFPHIIVDFDLRDAIRLGLVKSIALDKRSELASIPTEELDFRTEVDDEGNRQVSHGQTIMLQAGLRKLQILETDFARVDDAKHPKLLILTENTEASKAVEAYLLSSGIASEEMLRVDSDRKGNMRPDEWAQVKRQLAGLDRHVRPRIVISVLMLREGFDVNSICVVVPLRASQSGILLEQVIGRGLRLMWRGNADIDAKKAQDRRRIADGLEPETRFDLLSIVEHPAYEDFYDTELGDGQVGVDPDDGGGGSTGDVELVELREDYERFDFRVPFIVRDADEEIAAPSIDVMELEAYRVPLEQLKARAGKGDVFASYDAFEDTRFGEYRVEGGAFGAGSYGEYLSRIAALIDDTMGRARTASGERSRRRSEFPVLQVARPALIAMVDRYVRTRMFDRQFDPFEDENWRVLLFPEALEAVAGVFMPALIEQLDKRTVSDAIVDYRWLSEARSYAASLSRLVGVRKCIYTRLRIPEAGKGGGLERQFVEWADQDGRIDAFCKLDEHKHAWIQRPYVKSNGYPARYSPDFLVRTSSDVYVVETKAQSSLSDLDVHRKKRAALDWTERINELPEAQRDHLEWHYALVGERMFDRHREGGGSMIALLNQASLFAESLHDGRLF
ncbi:DEAD/DEAH box helicase family protein [Gulosibacter sp. 10]|uniref:DEAD/DEAH box helicase family protein n=1 Tax=Gulosibacter sp. 10 TaxID=1255570 RepID=UPI00097F0A12|nr:DEAD/DEAH box helicase family protein [Gulosibacter sp. 10]SJM50224.1 hypothetical protein FM112_01385 [Gulosibacter sp. 10]